MTKECLPKVRIGCDLDGVVARHSLGGFWVKVRRLKEKLLKKAHSPKYYYPKSIFEKEAWKVINWLRVPDKEGVSLLRSIKLCLLRERQKDGQLFFLITGRFEFNYPTTIKWLEKYKLSSLFEEVLVNIKDQDPIEFKVKEVGDQKITHFIDDDLEVLLALRKTGAKLYWVVPGHKDGKENHDSGIINCQNLKEALEKIRIAS